MSIDFSKNVDAWGLLDKTFMPDGGDTCHREGMFFSLLGMQKIKEQGFQTPIFDRFLFVMRSLHPSPGVLLRHSNPDYDASDWDRMSRDQLQPMVIACGYWSERELKKLAKGHLKRGFLFANNTRRNGATKKNHGTFVAGETRNYDWKIPDPTGPEIWGNFIRAFKCWPLYPLLLIFDIETFVGAIKWRWFPKHNIALNHTLSVLQSRDRMPTPWTYLSLWVMPMDKLIALCKEHLNDPYVAMPFLGELLEQTWNQITNKGETK